MVPLEEAAVPCARDISRRRRTALPAAHPGPGIGQRHVRHIRITAQLDSRPSPALIQSMRNSYNLGRKGPSRRVFLSASIRLGRYRGRGAHPRAFRTGRRRDGPPQRQALVPPLPGQNPTATCGPCCVKWIRSRIQATICG